MADTPRKSSISLDDLEQDIRPDKSDLVGRSPAMQDDDPLAELARLVGEDNPFTRINEPDLEPERPVEPSLPVEPKLDMEPMARPQTEGQPSSQSASAGQEEGELSIFADIASEFEAELKQRRAEPLVDDRVEDRADTEPSSNPFAEEGDAEPQSPQAKPDDGPSVVDIPRDPKNLSTDSIPPADMAPSAAERANEFDDLARKAKSAVDQKTRRAPTFSPVLENPGQPNFEPVSRAEPVAARMDIQQGTDRGAPENFEMPLDLSNTTNAPDAESTKIPEDLLTASLAAGVAASVSKSDAPAPLPPQPMPAAEDDPFAALEGALQREVDAVLSSGPGEFPAQEQAATNFEQSDDDEDSPGRGRGMMIAAAVVSIMLLGGAGAFVYRGLVGPADTDGAPVTITADGQPLKERPSDPGGTTVANQDALVFERAAGDTTGDDNAQIVSREEEVSPKAEDRVGSREQPRVIAPAAVQPGDDPNAPRRVRTMIVKPDGTIVRASEDSTTVTETAAVPLTPLPNVTGEVAAQTPVVISPSVGEVAAVETAAAIPDAPVIATPELALGPEDPTIPLPIPRPGNTSAAAAPAATIQTATAPVAAQPTVQPAAQQVTIPGAYSVQLASRRSQEQALGTFASFQQRYPTILGTYQPFIERADLGGRGIFYRLRVGPLASQSNASQLCDRLRQAGLSDCLIRRN